MTNFDLSQKIFDFLRQAQVQTVVVCAGARNAPLVMALAENSFDVIQFFEERSAAFYALGLMKATQKPVAVLTTSGTAVAELIPATIEAFYQGLPLIVVSADRPKAYRGSGAPQSIEQIKIFSDYVESVWDLDVHTSNFEWGWSFKKPIQLNVCFDEPLLDKVSAEAGPSLSLRQTLLPITPKPVEKIEKPLAILGELNTEQVPVVKKFILDHQMAVYAESLSQLVNDPDLKSLRIQSTDLLVKKLFQEKHFHSVIRIGGVPTLRFWRDLENQFQSIPVFNFSDRPFTGLARSSQIFSISSLTETQISSVVKVKDIFEADQQLQKQKLEIMSQFELSEPACVFHLSKQVGSAPLFLGNSLPIRHWDSFSMNRSSALYGNRGANGIDGQISTYLGWSEPYKSSFCLVGDLTALYDLASLGLTSQLQKNKRRIVVLNNFGGQIFQRVLKNKIFINEHQIQFKHWAQMWGWDYLLVKSTADFNEIQNHAAANLIIEIQPDEMQTQSFWDKWDGLCQKI